MPQPSYRAAILRGLDRLGYPNYNAYIASAHWHDVRRRYRESDLPQRCYCCDAEEVALHHTTYERLGRELLTDLKPLCHRCHAMVHDLDRRGEVLIDLNGLFDVARAWKHRVEWRERCDRLAAEDEAYVQEMLNKRALIALDVRIRSAKVIATARGVELRSSLRLMQRLLKKGAPREQIERQMRVIERNARGGDRITV